MILKMLICFDRGAPANGHQKSASSYVRLWRQKAKFASVSIVAQGLVRHKRARSLSNRLSYVSSWASPGGEGFAHCTCTEMLIQPQTTRVLWRFIRDIKNFNWAWQREIQTGNYRKNKVERSPNWKKNSMDFVEEQLQNEQTSRNGDVTEDSDVVLMTWKK